jgi:hypothetical protein
MKKSSGEKMVILQRNTEVIKESELLLCST